MSRADDLALTDGDREQWSPGQQGEKQRQLLKLAAAAPKRGPIGGGAQSRDLFAAADQPELDL